MTTTLEQTTNAFIEVTRCELGEVAETIIGHEDQKLLLPRWAICLNCRGYDTNCPRHPDYL